MSLRELSAFLPGKRSKQTLRSTDVLPVIRENVQEGGYMSPEWVFWVMLALCVVVLVLVHLMVLMTNVMDSIRTAANNTEVWSDSRSDVDFFFRVGGVLLGLGIVVPVAVFSVRYYYVNGGHSSGNFLGLQLAKQ